MTLAKIGQDDFSAGSYEGMAPERVPSNGFGGGINVLISDEGLPYRRGGSGYVTDATAGPDPLLAVWAGRLRGGTRLVAASDSMLYVQQGSALSEVSASATGIEPGYKPAVLGGLIVLPHGGSSGIAYGGRLDPVNYTAGTASVTLGSTAVVGVGTAWSTNASPGSIYLDQRAGGESYIVESVNDNTHLTLTSPMRGATGAGLSYAIAPIQSVGKAALFYFTAGNKLMACVDNRMYESAVDDPFYFPAGEFIDFPEGADLLGGEQLRDQAILFSRVGVFVVSGVAYDLTDADGNPQQRVELVNRELILWSAAGVATWANRLIVPAVDGIYLFDGISQPVDISGGVLERYRAHVAAGFKAGIATVAEGHYILPILDGADPVDQLVCRLRPTRRGRGGTAFGWTRNDDFAGEAAGVFLKSDDSGPLLLGAHANGRVSSLKFFEITTTTPTDADGSVYVAEIVTREFPAGGLTVALVRRLLARFELADPSTTNPTLSLAYSVDGGAWVALATTAGERDLTADSFPWSINKNAHGIRFRLRTANAVARFLLHALQVSVRPTGRAVK